MDRHALTLRRLRDNTHIRALVREVSVEVGHLVQPLFVVDGLKAREPIPGLTGTFRDTPATLLAQIESDLARGVSKFLLFPVPAEKRESGFDPTFAAAQIRAIKQRFGDRIWLSVDVCLCSYTTHGHCGVLTVDGGHVDNAASVESLTAQAISFAKAGADCVAPSDMMDGRIGAIRTALDRAGLERTLLMSYAAKFHSKFYGPFRVAADSAPRGGGLSNRATYQIDPARPGDALQSALRDADEGADIMMVKPGLPYLDILANLSKAIPKPWAVYEVSGEFAAIECLQAAGLCDGPLAHIESWTAFRRAGAQIIITYGARFAQEWLTRVTP